MPYLTTRKNLKLQLSPGLVAAYDIQPGNGVGLFWDTTHTPRTHMGVSHTTWTIQTWTIQTSKQGFPCR